MSRTLTRTVWILSLISLFTDLASEMLYPVMPIYLREIGFTVVMIGILEGLAEALAGLSKGYFGQLSDQTGRRMPFVRMGYLLSAVSKPLMATFTFPVWIFLVRCIDRLGKGVRTGARDAVLSDESTVATKGQVFGFHRAMDTLGAVGGPLIALLFLAIYPGNYTLLFLIAFIPGMLAVSFTLMIREKKKDIKKQTIPIRFLTFLRYWKESPVAYRKLTIGLLCFALVNSSDVFLLLKAKESGMNDTIVIGLYIFYNLVYAALAYPAGLLADKLGLKKVLVGGLFIFALVYAGMSQTTEALGFAVLFFIYGAYAACTEGVSKAWISNAIPGNQTATAIGTYTAFQSIAGLLSSSLAGLIWYFWGAPVLFFGTGIAALLIAFYFIFSIKYAINQ
ncbi:MAG: MFS transporter [Bacteroidia bacterium]|jgi:MFS family permease